MSELTVVAEGLRFPEGPIAMPDGSVLLVELLNFLDRAYASCICLRFILAVYTATPQKTPSEPGAIGLSPG